MWSEAHPGRSSEDTVCGPIVSEELFMTPPQPVQPQVGPGQGGPLASRGLSSSSKGILVSSDWLLLSCPGSSSVETPPWAPPVALLAPCTTKPPTDYHFTCVCVPVERHRLPPLPRESPERFAEGRPSPLGKQGPEGRHQMLPPLVHAPPPPRGSAHLKGGPWISQSQYDPKV